MLKLGRVNSVIDEKMAMKYWWNDTEWGKPKYWEKSCLSATSSTSSLGWNDPGSNPVLDNQGFD
jgi:hypothetical protein